MRRGDVVLVDWVFTDMTGSKLRPAIVIQADFLNGLIDDTIFVAITGKRHGLPGTEVMVDPSVEPSSGLKKVSYVFCTNLMTGEQARVYQTLGYLSATTLQQIEACLKTVLVIP